MRATSPRAGSLTTTPRALIVCATTCSFAQAVAAPADAGDIREAEWPLDTGHFNAQRIWATSGGGGVTVAVIDSGVHAAHAHLTGQVLPWTGFIGATGENGRTDVSSDAHGASIAEIIAGTGRRKAESA